MRPDLENVNLLELTPVRCATWSQVDDRVVIDRPAPRVRGLRGLIEKAEYWMSVKSLRLDEMGTFVWLRLDGTTSVAAIVEGMQSDLGGDQLEERVGLFVRGLRSEGLIGFPGWDDVGEA